MARSEETSSPLLMGEDVPACARGELPSNDDAQTAYGQRGIVRWLYISHSLSMWNSRAFEFGAFLFLATIFPQTLLPASIYAMARSASAATLSPWLGSHIDTAERLPAIRMSIVGQRLPVLLSCAALLALQRAIELQTHKLWTVSLLGLLILLACIEKLSTMLNTISVERDWVVVISEGDESRLRTMNSQMRRIDLFCKIMAPLFISVVDSASSQVAILVTSGISAVSVLIEYFTIARVHSAVPALQSRPDLRTSLAAQSSHDGFGRRLARACKGATAYFRHAAFMPSFALALLYLTALSFSGQMITWLLATGFTSSTVGILRAISSLSEISSTWIAPRVMERIGPVRAGLWFINCLIGCIFIACALFWAADTSPLMAWGVIGAVIVSRVGLWGFDLNAQILVQEEVEPELRGTFSSREYAFRNIFEMLSFMSTIVFADPALFKYPATLSLAGVTLAGILYTAFVRSRRGHLVHLSGCMNWHGKGVGASHTAWQRMAQ